MATTEPTEETSGQTKEAKRKQGRGRRGRGGGRGRASRGRMPQRTWKARGERAFLDFLLRTPVENIKPRSQFVGAVPSEKKNRVVVVKLTDSISYVWKLLATENFLSTPVVDTTGTRYCGTIDVMDLIRFTAALFPSQTMEEKGILVAREIWAKSAAFKDATVATLLQASWFQGRVTLTPTYTGFSTLSAWESMSKLGFHRLTVLNEMGEIANILTQSMCISVLAQNIQNLGPMAKDTVLQLGTVPRLLKPESKDIDLNNTSWSHTWSEDLALLKQDGKRLTAYDKLQSWNPAEGQLGTDGKTITMKFGTQTLTGVLDAQRSRIFWSNKAIWYRTVLSCNETDVTIHAFNKMIDHNVTGLAVVNSEGTLVGSLSIRDLRGVGLNADKFYRLYLSVKDFKEVTLKEFPQLNPVTKEPMPNSALYVVPTDTLETVIKKMNDGNIHRVFVVSAASVQSGAPRPVSILSQRDIMLYVLLRLGNCRPNFSEPAPPVWNI